MGVHKSLQKKYLPTSGYRTMTSFGFPILKLVELPRLADFKNGGVLAHDVSSKPLGFRARGIFSNRKETLATRYSKYLPKALRPGERYQWPLVKVHTW